MLLDEWIGAGDAEFLEKARQRMKSQVEGSRIVVVASHNLKLIRRLCNRALLLEAGQVVADGSAAEVIAEYHARIRGRKVAAGSR